METSYTLLSTPIGELLIAGNESAVTQVRYDADTFLAQHCELQQAEAGSVVGRAAQSIRNFLHGESECVDVALELQGTELQKAVWAELQKIPYGTTTSYSIIAERLGRPAAFRAVANACGKNPVPVIIPCHRVLHKDGSVSGFAWGVDVKKALLALEARRAPHALAA